MSRATLTRIGLDSNILAYFLAVRRLTDDGAKVVRTQAVIDRLGDRGELIAPVQALGDLTVVLRRSGRTMSDAKEQVEALAASFITAPSTEATFRSALQLASDHALQFWDSLIIAASLEAGCTLLLSEDMQDGFAVRGLTVVNPLLEKPHSALAVLLDS